MDSVSWSNKKRFFLQNTYLRSLYFMKAELNILFNSFSQYVLERKDKSERLNK